MLAGAVGGMLAAGMGVGVLAGALTAPNADLQAAVPIVLRFAPAVAVATATASPLAPLSPSPAPATTTPAAPSATPTRAPQHTHAHAEATSPPTATPDSTPSASGGGQSGDRGSKKDDKPQRLKLPAIKHVWLVVLADQSFDALFSAPSQTPYLTGALIPQGTLLSDYHAIAHGAGADGVALVSGQGPNPDLQAGCPTYGDLAPGHVDAATGQANGHGCVFPATVSTVADQLAANHLTWRAYVAGEGAPGDAPASCRHPALGTPDPSAAAIPADGYITRRNPFVLFHSVVDQQNCSTNDVGLDQLGADLAAADPPNLSYVAPSLCDAGAAGACAAGAPATGAAAADAFLQKWIPQIQATAAYKSGGLVVVLSDQAPATGEGADATACCKKVDYPNSDDPGGDATPGPGGGRTGALVLSPFAAKGVTDRTPSDHFTLLRTIEEIFNLPSLGYASLREPFGSTVFPSETGGNETVTS
jgi:hypothetical protein